MIHNTEENTNHNAVGEYFKDGLYTHDDVVKLLAEWGSVVYAKDWNKEMMLKALEKWVENK